MSKSTKKILAIVLAVVVVIAIIFAVTKLTNKTEPQVSETTVTEVAPAAEEKAYTFTYVDADGNEKSFDLKSDKDTVGEALLEEGLIAGEDSQYGLYVKEVDGITADYDKDGTYWAFYIDGEYASTGVDSTPLEAGHVYTFKVEK